MNDIRYGEKTDPGRVRKHNEDAMLCDPELGIWLVADGMGGHESGEVASAIAIEAIHGGIKSGMTLQQAFAAAHKAILQGVEDQRGRPGMGTTGVALRILDNHYELVWVGDSRAYLFWNNRLIQRTRDHTFVQALMDAGQISLEDARIHPLRHAITRALGMSGQETVESDIVTGNLIAGSRIMLCSDGLSGEVDEEQMVALLQSTANDQEAVDRLVQAAKENGGGDNITVILLTVPALSAFSLARVMKSWSHQRKTGWFGWVLALVGMLAVGWGVWQMVIAPKRAMISVESSAIVEGQIPKKDK